MNGRCVYRALNGRCVTEQWMGDVWQSSECRRFLDFLRQSYAWVSVSNVMVLILAVCRYVNAFGYCMGRWVSTSVWKMYIVKHLLHISLQFLVLYDNCQPRL
jgi:hypothetical protein